MASIDDLQRRRRLEEERDAVSQAISRAVLRDDAEEIETFQRILAKIELELTNCEPNFADVPAVPPVPVLPDSSFHELMPSQRAKYTSSWNEGAPKRRKR